MKTKVLTWWRILSGVAVVALVSCAAPVDEDTGEAEGAWDSEDGNPTHSTHSLMAEWAIDNVEGDYPEVKKHASAILEGANLELHEFAHPKYERLRQEVGGNNWGADHPEILWKKARTAYAANDLHKAYFYVGILLHYVQDMGVPAHAFHVIHQNKPTNWDTMELLGLFRFRADMKRPGSPNPKLDDPTDYIEWSATRAREQFASAFPEERTYGRTFYPERNRDVSDKQWDFLEQRETDCTLGTAYALRSAARAFASLSAE